MPLLFVGDAPNDERAAAVRAAYDDPATVTRRTADLGGATVCFAEPIEDDPDPKGDPRLPTSSITFDAGKVISQSRFHANFYPEIDTAQVGIRAVQRLLGQPQAVVPVRYPDEYRKNAFAGANKGEVFLQTVTDYALEFGGGTGQAKSDALGALATPSMAIQGLSRIMGPAADLGAVQSDSFNPVNFFKDAKILGGIPLSSLLTTVTGLAGDDVPEDALAGAARGWRASATRRGPLRLDDGDHELRSAGTLHSEGGSGRNDDAGDVRCGHHAGRRPCRRELRGVGANRQLQSRSLRLHHRSGSTCCGSMRSAARSPMLRSTCTPATTRSPSAGRSSSSTSSAA